MTRLLLQLLLGAALVLGALALGVSAILHEQEGRRRFRDRMTQVAAHHVKVNPFVTRTRAGTVRRPGPALLRWPCRARLRPACVQSRVRPDRRSADCSAGVA